jgi:hypothetical protein
MGMRSITGTILLAQESRFRLLTEDGRGETFLLAHDAPIEPQDLPPLVGRRARIRFSPAPQLMAGVAHDLVLLEEPGP